MQQPQYLHRPSIGAGSTPGSTGCACNIVGNANSIIPISNKDSILEKFRFIFFNLLLKNYHLLLTTTFSVNTTPFSAVAFNT